MIEKYKEKNDYTIKFSMWISQKESNGIRRIIFYGEEQQHNIKLMSWV